MSVDKIRADFVVVGEPNQHYLEKANQLLVDFLKKEPYGFSGCWIEDQVQRFYGQLKFNEDEITPKREINLLWDNGHMLFLPESFKEYIKKNEESGVVGYLGHLTDSL